MSLSEPMLRLLTRLEVLSRGESDPLEELRASQRIQARLEAEGAWEAALPGGSGYSGERGWQ